MRGWFPIVQFDAPEGVCDHDAMILLETLLDGLEVRVETFSICTLEPGQRLELPALPQASVHYSLAGAGTIRCREGARLSLGRHGFLVLPPNCPSSLLCEPEPRAAPAPSRPCERLSRAGPLLEAAGEGAALTLACGRITATYQSRVGLFDHLSEPLIDSFACSDGICRTFEALLGELADPKPGTKAMADSLMQQCLVLVLRRYCASGECRLPWLSALEDPRLGRALEAILAHPEDDFSLEGLADLAGMSRSAFASHFHDAFERTPIDFVKEVRLNLAARLLRTTDLPVKVVARRVGYASRSYFSRAFKARYRVDPLGFRQGSQGFGGEPENGRLGG